MDNNWENQNDKPWENAPWENNNEQEKPWEDNSNDEDNLDQLLNASHEVEESQDVEKVEDQQEEKEEKEPSLSFPTDIVDHLEPIPGSAKNAPAFSEKNVYRILNLVTIMKACDEDETNIVGGTFGVRGGIVRKSMSIVEMEDDELKDRTAVLSVLAKIRKTAVDDIPGDPFDFTMNLFSRVDDMKAEQRATMISLVRSYQDTIGAKRVKINKSSSTSDLIKEIKGAMTGEKSIATLIEQTGAVIEAVEEVLG